MLSEIGYCFFKVGDMLGTDKSILSDLSMNFCSEMFFMRGWNDMLGLNVFHIVKESKHHEVSYDVVNVAPTAFIHLTSVLVW